MGVKEGQTSSLNFDNGLLAEKTERPPAPIPKTKLTAKNRSEFADLISQYADYTNMVSLVLRLVSLRTDSEIYQNFRIFEKF